ncbi:oligosaccharide flippase family protein [Neobacillus dielmonensis]|uniref:oligosaccharide flippase family protein n=1 Tax=Neobacillus dielmonensis TaxID=1347369 RepID=UPI00069376B2|nr:oligosaccharide flippase family protein [Neobacillus dielmonensis]
MNPSKALVRGAFILTAAAMITKIFSAIYRIPFQNIVGDIGFYIYQQIYPFYGMAVVLSTSFLELGDLAMKIKLGCLWFSRFFISSCLD